MLFPPRMRMNGLRVALPFQAPRTRVKRIAREDRFERVGAATAFPRTGVRNTISSLEAITAERVARMLREDSIARRCCRQLERHGTELVLDFGLGPSRV